MQNIIPLVFQFDSKFIENNNSLSLHDMANKFDENVSFMTLSRKIKDTIFHYDCMYALAYKPDSVKDLYNIDNLLTIIHLRALLLIRFSSLPEQSTQREESSACFMHANMLFLFGLAPSRVFHAILVT